jgi:formylglycine-generating enzyme required for sulfatase activity
MKIPAAALLIAALGAGAPALRSLLDTPDARPGPETVQIPAGEWDWRPSGTWRLDGRQVDPPLRHLTSDAPLDIMRFQVSRGDYALCVADAACDPALSGPASEPQTGVNWHDATAYALWLSDRTGDTWRLPTDAEWQRAAAERFADDALGQDADFTTRWLAKYDQEAASQADPVVRPLGGWGDNSLGVADIGGNVWEWTTDCAVTATLSPKGEELTRSDFCGARVAQGRHRATVIDFVRDASAGGCAAGVPPDHLGFRLVRED